MSWSNLYSLLGCLSLLTLAWLSSADRRRIHWKTVLLGMATMGGLGLVIFLWPAFRSVLLLLNRAVNGLIASSGEGARFLFGPLAAGPGEAGGVGFILAFQVLPSVVFFSVVTSLFYYLGVLPAIVWWTARAAHKGFHLSGAEALSTTSNLFVGVESALIVRPFIERMTRSELMMLLTAGLSTIASTVLAFYVGLLNNVFPFIAGHLISASVLSIPAAVVMAKIVVPEDSEPETMKRVPRMENYIKTEHWIGSIIWGAGEGVRLAVGIGALLIGMLGLVELLDLMLGGSSSWIANRLFGVQFSLTLRTLLEILAYPLILCLGLSPEEWSHAAQLIGERWILTEVVAYQDLAKLVEAGSISPRGLLILSYALCGFTHVASVAIFVGGLAALAPERRDDLARLSWRAFWAATLATLLTGAVAGAFYHGQAGLIG